MGIDPADAPSVQSIALHELEDFGMLHLRRRRERAKQTEDLAPVPQGSACQFADDKGVSEDLPMLEQTSERSAAHAKVIDPDRCVDEDHTRITPRAGFSGAGSA